MSVGGLVCGYDDGSYKLCINAKRTLQTEFPNNCHSLAIQI